MPARLVALDLPPGDAFAAALDEAWAAGDAVLPLDPYAPPAVRDALRRALAVGEPIDDRITLVIATSGTTGEPKGAQLSKKALDASARATMRRIGQRHDDHWLSCLPWHHIGGLQVLLRARLANVPLTVHERFDSERFASETQATLTSLVPTQLRRLLDGGVDLSRFHVILLGGAPASPALLERARDNGARIVTTYGMSETAGGCVYDGVPLDGVEARIGDDERIELKGPMLMSGYRGGNGNPIRDGWLKTNDIGAIDADGKLVVRGRIDDVVVTGGENVRTEDVTRVFGEHPAIADIAITGVPDDEWGERVVAVAVLSDETTLDELRRWAASRLPPAALPRALVRVDALPLLASGKPDRTAIQAIAVQDAAGTAVIEPPRSHSAAPPST